MNRLLLGCTLPTPYHLWENEYNWLFGNYEPENLDYDLETLHQWYDETYQRYCKDKGRKGNSLLGSTIEYIIESDYSIEEQLEATEHYIRGIFSDLGIETDFKETMARNELMAKYMMQNSSFKNSIKDYSETISFMTENLQRGTHEEQNTHTVVTSDFQTLEFPYTMDRRFREHSDEDGISDGVELGNEKWMNITEFVRKAYEDAVKKGKSHKATFEEQVEDIIEKNGAYTDFGGNKVYGSVKWSEDKTKVLYRTYDYKSNPKLNDTDFDGIWDNKEKDELKLVNRFKGTSTDIGKVEYNQDFRWFYTDNKKYNDELAVMSLIMSNLADGNTINTNQASGDIRTYLTSIGFSNIQNIGEGSDNIYIAKKTIQYYDNKKDVIGVFFGKCDKWLSEIIKHKEMQKVQTTNKAFKESLESYINRIVNKVNLLDTLDCSYWVAGYDVGGSIASEVASELVEEGKTVYAYTFGAFNTRDKLDTKNEIKNIRNEDDFIIKYIKGTKPGQSYGASIFENLMFEYRDLTESWDYESKYEFSNFLLKIYNETKFTRLKNDEENIDDSKAYSVINNYLINFSEIKDEEFIENYPDITILLNKNRKSNKQAHSIKSYYVLAKSLDGFNILDGDGKKQEHYKRIDKAMVVAFTGTEVTKGDDELGDLDGYKFIYKNKVINYDDYNNDNIYLNTENDETIRINDYVYTNYTISNSSVHHYDIDYTRFWNISNEEQTMINNLKQEFINNETNNSNNNRNILKRNAAHMELFDIKAGDFSTNQTKYTVTRYSSSGYCGYGTGATDFSRNMVKSWLEYSANLNDEKQQLGINDKLLTLDGRIVAAFPVALLNEENDNNEYTAENMNYHKYYGGSDGRYGNGERGLRLSLDASADKMYKYVDCVYEIVEDDEHVAHQFVVPYMVINPKWLHHYDKPNSIDGINYISGIPNYAHFYACFTDNRYGQVYQKKYHTSEDAKKIYNNGEVVGYYVHRDDRYTNDYISPIEPFTKNGVASNEKINELIGSLFGFYNESAKVRIVSMRIYDKTFCNYDSSDGSYDIDNPLWWTTLKNEFESKEINNYDCPLYNESNIPNKIIIYD